MKLTNEVLKKIKSPQIRMKIGLALKVTDQAVSKYIKANSENLTKAAALLVICSETKLDQSEVLEEK